MDNRVQEVHYAHEMTAWMRPKSSSCKKAAIIEELGVADPPPLPNLISLFYSRRRLVLAQIA